MEKSSVLHIPKSNYSYAICKNELVLILRTKRNDFDKVILKYTDPFLCNKGIFETSLLEMKRLYQTNFFDYYKVKLNTSTKRTR